MAVDDKIQVAAGGTGTAIDNTAITRYDGTQVDRQRINISAPEDPNVHLNVSGEAQRGEASVRSPGMQKILMEILIELKGLREDLAELAHG